jgi:hypothetical protein
MTRVEDLGQISINRAEFHAYTHILWSLTKKLEKTDDMIVNIYTDSECGVSWSRKLKEKESKGAAKRQKNKALMENWLLASQDRRVYRQLVEKFAAVSINWISRDKIVPVLGH